MTSAGHKNARTSIAAAAAAVAAAEAAAVGVGGAGVRGAAEVEAAAAGAGAGTVAGGETTPTTGSCSRRPPPCPGRSATPASTRPHCPRKHRIRRKPSCGAPPSTCTKPSSGSGGSSNTSRSLGGRQGLTLVHFSAQPEPCLKQITPCTPRNIPSHPLNIPYTIPKCTPSPTQSAYVEPKSGQL